MYSSETENYNLPQWQPNDKPTFLGDFNEAFRKIDAQMKINYDLARQGGSGGVPQSLIDQVNQNSNDIRTLILQAGNDAILSIGSSITNAIVNLKSAIDTMATNISGIADKIGTDVIAGVGSSITNAIKNLSNTLTSQTQILHDLGIKIGTDAIDTIGTSITNAIVNLKSAIDTATTNITNINNLLGDYFERNLQQLHKDGLDDLIGNDELNDSTITKELKNLWDEVFGLNGLRNTVYNITLKIGTDAIDAIGTSITNAIVNLNNKIEKKIYQHTIGLRGGNGYNKFEITLLRNNDTPLNASQLTQLIKDKCSIYDSTSSGYVLGLPITGAIKPESSTQSFQAISIFYSLDANKLCVKYLNTSLATAYQQEYIDEITIPSAPSLYSIIEII